MEIYYHVIMESDKSELCRMGQQAWDPVVLMFESEDVLFESKDILL